MIVESIIGVFFVSVLAYLYWKSIEGEMNEILPAAKDTKLVDEKEIDLENIKIKLEISPYEATANVEVTEPTGKPKRARKANGKFIGDDKSTGEVNEAWVGGKAPTKQAKPKATKTAKPAAESSTDKPARKPRARKPKMTVLK
jgi:hypothetical protein